MTKVVFYKHNGVFYGFHEVGHAGYGEFGTDIICSALSAMTMLIINTIEVSWGVDVKFEMDEETTDITVTVKEALPEYASSDEKQYAVSGLIQGYFYQLMDMIEDYGDYIDVEEEEKPI
ncbi:MAG: ribosomal-processing cysteine protease Prp [Clostridia bacterium]|nr:ribosomal-processing cysteine protease Prp [Clostridia bacterium]MBR6744658.1 ribosomal-processing cysteine protease Prp [Clostridia bacterium]